MKRAVAIFLFASASAVFAGERTPEVSVTLELPYVSVLPGVPFDLNVVYRNLSNRRVSVGRTATMIITPLGGKAARLERRDKVDFVPDSANVELEPGQERRGFISWSSAWFGDDYAHTVPGTYDISLELTGKLDEPEEGTVYAGTVHTTMARLVRIEPEGEDAVVWKRMQAAGGGMCPSRCFGRGTAARTDVGIEVIATHAGSQYYPYALLLTYTLPVARLDVLREATDRFRDSPAYPHLLFTAGAAAHSEADKAERRRAPFAEVEDFLELAVSFFEQAQKTNSVAAKEGANSGLFMVKNRIERLRHPFVPH